MRENASESPGNCGDEQIIREWLFLNWDVPGQAKSLISVGHGLQRFTMNCLCDHPLRGEH